MKAHKETIKSAILIVILVAAIAIPMVGLFIYNESSVTKEYSLSELNDGIYGIYTVVSSSIPAQNYEMITLCANGQVYTFKGHVNIHYCKNGFKLILEDKNSINSDTMHVYVPFGSIEYSANVGIGSRK